MSDTLQGDWEWMIKVLKMSADRAIDGQRITLHRPKNFSASADMKYLMKAAMIRQIETILSTAEIVDQD